MLYLGSIHGIISSSGLRLVLLFKIWNSVKSREIRGCKNGTLGINQRSAVEKSTMK